MKLIAFLFSTVLVLNAQQPIYIVEKPSATQVFNVYDGSNRLTASCEAISLVTTGQRSATSVAISAATNANPVVFTSTGHGFTINTLPSVTVSGATGGWTGVNVTAVATVIDANTFSIPVNSTAFGALAGTVVFRTTAPRQTVAEWKVKKLAYDGSGNLLFTAWLKGSSAYGAKCSDNASTTVQMQ